jgi:hypothetical protein
MQTSPISLDSCSRLLSFGFRELPLMIFTQSFLWFFSSSLSLLTFILLSIYGLVLLPMFIKVIHYQKKKKKTKKDKQFITKMPSCHQGVWSPSRDGDLLLNKRISAPLPDADRRGQASRI